MGDFGRTMAIWYLLDAWENRRRKRWFIENTKYNDYSHCKKIKEIIGAINENLEDIVVNKAGIDKEIYLEERSKMKWIDDISNYPINELVREEKDTGVENDWESEFRYMVYRAQDIYMSIPLVFGRKAREELNNFLKKKGYKDFLNFITDFINDTEVHPAKVGDKIYNGNYMEFLRYKKQELLDKFYEYGEYVSDKKSYLEKLDKCRYLEEYVWLDVDFVIESKKNFMDKEMSDKDKEKYKELFDEYFESKKIPVTRKNFLEKNVITEKIDNLIDSLRK